MVVQIQLRRDQASDWTSNNPTLAEGEIGYETDTGYMKVGDGSTSWSSLDYFSGSGAVANSTLAGVMEGNISGSSYTYGFKDINFISSQAISGGTIIGGLHYPCNYLITKEGNTTYCKTGATGKVLYSNTNSYDTFQYAINQLSDANGGTLLINPGEYYISSTIMVSGDSSGVDGNPGYNLTIVGCGKYATKLIAAQDVDTFQFGVSTNSYYGYVNYLYLGNMWLYGNNKNCSGIYGWSLTRSRIQDMKIEYYEHFGINLRFNHTIDIANCDIRYNGNSDQLSTQYPWNRLSVGGIRLGHADDSSQRYSAQGPYNLAHIQNCNLEYNYDGIWINGGSQHIIRDNNMEGETRHGVFLAAKSGNITGDVMTVENCWFESNNLGDEASESADVYVSGNVRLRVMNIINNIFSRQPSTVDNYGVCMRGNHSYPTQGINIQKNRFADGEFTNIRLSGCSNINISDNYLLSSLTFEGCTGISPIDISQWYNENTTCAFKTLERSVNNDGLIFYVPPICDNDKHAVYGYYSIKDTINITHNNVSIVGEGPGSNIRLNWSTNKDFIYASGVNGLNLRNIYINDNGTNNTTSNAIQLYNTDNCTVSNCIIMDGSINGITASSCTRLKINQSIISGNTGYGLRLKSCDNCLVTDNIFQNNTAGNVSEVS